MFKHDYLSLSIYSKSTYLSSKVEGLLIFKNTQYFHFEWFIDIVIDLVIVDILWC